MNALMKTTAQEITMTSLELVEFINGERVDGEAILAHSDFLKKVPQVLGELVAGNFSCYYKASNGKQNPMFTFPKREACLMAMSYSYDLQAKVFDRMTMLEQKNTIDPMQVLNNPELMRGYLLTYSEKVITLENKVIALMPKVEAFERLTIADGEVSLQTAGKLLQQRPNKFIQWLREIGWLYKRAGSQNNLPVAAKFNAGYLTVREAILIKADGTEQLRQQTVVTAKGLSKLAMLLGVNVQPDLLEAQ